MSEEAEEEIPRARLLDVLNFDYVARGPKRTVPRMIEFPVGETSPYLVSSTRALIWVKRASLKGSVRAAVREREGFYTEVCKAVEEAGLECGWGNVHPLSTKGLDDCVEHLASYGFKDIHLLAGPASDENENLVGFDSRKFADNGITITGALCLDLPPDWVVMVPADRTFLGFVGTIGPTKLVSVLHNPARGMAIARPEPVTSDDDAEPKSEHAELGGDDPDSVRAD